MQEQDRETRHLQYRVRNTFSGKVVAVFEKKEDAIKFQGDANHLYTTSNDSNPDTGRHPWMERETAPESPPE